jgi:hypothetical protein
MICERYKQWLSSNHACNKFSACGFLNAENRVVSVPAAFGMDLELVNTCVVNIRNGHGDEIAAVIFSSPTRKKFHLLRGVNMTRVRNIVTACVLALSLSTVSYGGIITGSRTGATGSRAGTITGSRTGTITGSRAGTITGSKVGTITGSGSESPRSVRGNIHADFLLQLMSLVLNAGW